MLIKINGFFGGLVKLGAKAFYNDAQLYGV